MGLQHGQHRASAGGTGGGASLIEAAPSWQLSAKVLGTSTRRGVPDLAFVGDPSSGAITLVKGSKLQYGGTSLAAPIFAGFWARIQSANKQAGVPCTCAVQIRRGADGTIP
jgi:pseudomonalisin/xanthomonalisin